MSSPRDAMAGSRGACEIDPRNAYIRLRAGTKGGRGNVFDSGWGAGGNWTRDLTKVRAHAERGGNLAILTGRRSGHFTIDVDPKNGGLETLAALEAEYGPLPKTNTVRTPSGGLHLNYRLPVDFEVGNDSAGAVFGEGIDVKGEYGFRVAPGSRTSGGSYSLENDAGYAPCADWALRLLRDHFERRAKRQIEESPATPPAKAPNPPPCCESAARTALRKLTLILDQLSALPDGARLRLTRSGPEVGWDDGYWRIAARLVEIADWPWTSVSLEEVRRLFEDHSPDAQGSFDPDHAWEQGLRHAGSWFKGGTHRLESHGPTVLDRSADGLGPAAAELGGAEPERSSIGDRFPILDLELLDPDRPPRKWLLDGVVPEGDHVSIVAPGGTGKSLFGLALSIAAVRGDSQFIGRALNLRPGAKVVYVDKENSDEDWRERLMSFGVTIENAREFWGTTFIPLSFPPIGGLDTPEGRRTLLDVLDFYDVGRGDVLVLDSTQRLTEGPENDNDTMRALYEVVEVLKRRGITVIRTDNTGKDTERGARGASAKNDDVGYSWLLERRSRSNNFSLRNTKFRGLGRADELHFTILVSEGLTTFLPPIESAALGSASSLDQWYKDHFRVAVMDILRRFHDGASAEGPDKSNLVTQNRLLDLARAEEFDYYDPASGVTEKRRLRFSKRKGIEWLGDLAAAKHVRVEGGEEHTSRGGVVRVSTKYYGWREDLPEDDRFQGTSSDLQEEAIGNDESEPY